MHALGFPDKNQLESSLAIDSCTRLWFGRHTSLFQKWSDFCDLTWLDYHDRGRTDLYNTGPNLEITENNWFSVISRFALFSKLFKHLYLTCRKTEHGRRSLRGNVFILQTNDFRTFISWRQPSTRKREDVFRGVMLLSSLTKYEAWGADYVFVYQIRVFLSRCVLDIHPWWMQLKMESSQSNKFFVCVNY